MAEQDKGSRQGKQLRVMDWAGFLADCPPDVSVEVTDAVELRHTKPPLLVTPRLQMYCEEEGCEKPTFHEEREDIYVQEGENNMFLNYVCRNCGKGLKTFAVRFWFMGVDQYVAYKFGEIPPFGPPIPSRTLRLVGPDRHIFLKGYRAEKRGLGIGAFAYYRRVVENQFSRLLGEVLRVARTVGAEADMLQRLEAAQHETQFSKAAELVKDAMPGVLLLNGHNPLTLLHRPLSHGLHSLSDEQCLSYARAIRVVLFDLAEKLAQALREDKEVKDALTALLGEQSKKEQQPR